MKLICGEAETGSFHQKGSMTFYLKGGLMANALRPFEACNKLWKIVIVIIFIKVYKL